MFDIVTFLAFCNLIGRQKHKKVKESAKREDGIYNFHIPRPNIGIHRFSENLSSRVWKKNFGINYFAFASIIKISYYNGLI